jgi:hypothetical protein
MGNGNGHPRVIDFNNADIVYFTVFQRELDGAKNENAPAEELKAFQANVLKAINGQLADHPGTMKIVGH